MSVDAVLRDAMLVAIPDLRAFAISPAAFGVTARGAVVKRPAIRGRPRQPN
jgi:hypothetical protein